MQFNELEIALKAYLESSNKYVVIPEIAGLLSDYKDLKENNVDLLKKIVQEKKAISDLLNSDYFICCPSDKGKFEDKLEYLKRVIKTPSKRLIVKVINHWVEVNKPDNLRNNASWINEIGALFFDHPDWTFYTLEEAIIAVMEKECYSQRTDEVIQKAKDYQYQYIKQDLKRKNTIV